MTYLTYTIESFFSLNPRIWGMTSLTRSAILSSLTTVITLLHSFKAALCKDFISSFKYYKAMLSILINDSSLALKWLVNLV